MRFLVLALASSALVAACSSSSPPSGACHAYVVPADFNATTPAVSFQKDVWPILQRSCALSTSCHGSETGGNQAALYLGKNVANVYTALVNAKSTKYPSMLRVTPNDAKNSFLMHKLDDDACTLPNCTTDDGCANSMPSDQAPGATDQLLSVADRDTVRRWILQGAANN